MDPVVRRILFAGIACWAAGAIVILLASTGATAGVDQAVLAALLRVAEAGSLTSDTMRLATWLGDWERRLVLAGVFFAYLAWRRFGRAASYILYTTLGIWALNGWLLKPLFARARPDMGVDPALVPASHSLPSGHAANMATVAVAIALVASVIWWRKAQRRAIWLAALLLAGSVGVSRVGLGVHWPSDVIAGWLVGAGWALLLAALLRPVKARSAAA